MVLMGWDSMGKQGKNKNCHPNGLIVKKMNDRDKMAFG
jgi:hypothetical protein